MPFTMMFNVLPGHLSSTPTALLSAMLLSLAPQPVARLFFIKKKIRRTKTYKQLLTRAIAIGSLTLRHIVFERVELFEWGELLDVWMA